MIIFTNSFINYTTLHYISTLIASFLFAIIAICLCVIRYRFVNVFSKTLFDSRHNIVVGEVGMIFWVRKISSDLFKEVDSPVSRLCYSPFEVRLEILFITV